MPYLNEEVYNASDLGLEQELGEAWYEKLWGAAKTGSDIYQLQKQQAAAAAAAMVPSPAQQAAIQAALAPPKTFLQKHGLKLAIGAGGILVLFLVLRKKK